jgi:hypothetical protein
VPVKAIDGSGFDCPVCGRTPASGVVWSTPVHDETPQMAAVALPVNVTLTLDVATSGATSRHSSARTFPAFVADVTSVNASPL